MLALVHPTQPTPSSMTTTTTTTQSSSALGRQPSLRKTSSTLASCSLSTSSSTSSSLGSKRPTTTATAAATTSTPQLTHRHTAPPHIHTTAHTPHPPPPTPPPVQSTATTPSRPSLDIHTYPSAELLRLLASLLTQIASTNDKLSPPTSPSSSLPSPRATHTHPPIWSTLTTASKTSLSTPSSPLAFHARNVPTISLEAYLLRILKYCPATNDVFLALLVYFDRMAKLSLEARGRAFVIDSFNVHRLVIAGVTVSSKFFSDVFYTNSRYAKVGGLPQHELNQLELQFLLLNDFRLVIPADEMQRYAEQLILFSETHGASSPSTSTLVTETSPPRALKPKLVLQPPTHQSQQQSHEPPPSSQSLSHSSSFTHPHHSSHHIPQHHHPHHRIDTNGTATPAAQAAMGAIDAYGGSVVGSASKSYDHHPPPPPSRSPSQNPHIHQNGIKGTGTPRPIIWHPGRRRTSSDSHHSSDSGRDDDHDEYDYDEEMCGSGYTTEDTIETETDSVETDDETTIRPARSRDSLSSCSTQASSVSVSRSGSRTGEDKSGDVGMGSP